MVVSPGNWMAAREAPWDCGRRNGVRRPWTVRGQSVDGGRIALALAGPVGSRRFTYLKVPVAWAHTRFCSS